MNDAVAASTLYVVATPIGHRGDLSPRALAVLGAVDAIAAEDTRTSGALLAGFGVETPLVSLHEHNERQRVDGLLRRLGQGQSLALVSDAGTPLISDPGFVLVRAAREAGFDVLTVPGPCAAIAALSVSGLPSDRFYFAGFVAAKSAARREQFARLAGESATMIFYVSKRQAPHALSEAADVFGPTRPAALCRELTKRFEETRLSTLGGLLESWPDEGLRGEFVLLIGGNPAPRAGFELDAVLDLLLDKLSTRDAAGVAAALTGVSRRDAYQAALERKQPRS